VLVAISATTQATKVDNEVLKIGDQLRAAIIDNEPATTLREIAAHDGFRSIQSIGRMMVLDGILTIDEYQRNLIFN
jgi:type IV pilus assembly protein PilB